MGVLDGLIFVLRNILRRRRERRRRRKRKGGRKSGSSRVETVKYEEWFCLTYENSSDKK